MTKYVQWLCTDIFIIETVGRVIAQGSFAFSPHGFMRNSWRSDTGAGFSSSLFGYPMLIIILHCFTALWSCAITLTRQHVITTYSVRKLGASLTSVQSKLTFCVDIVPLSSVIISDKFSR